MRHFGWIALAASATGACFPSPKTLPIDLKDGDVALVALTDGKQAIVGLGVYVYASGAKVAFAKPKDAQVFLWKLGAEDFVHPDGQPLSPQEIAAVEMRPTGTHDPDQAKGSCGRCLVPTLTRPQIVNDGDACAIPAFAAGAAYADSGDALEPKTDAASLAATEALRKRIELAWPNACACSPPQAGMGLEAIDVLPIAPSDRPYPLGALAERSGDPSIIAGFAEGAAVLFDLSNPAGPRQTISPRAPEGEVLAAAGIEGGDFLVAVSSYNLRYTEGSTLLRYTMAQGGFAEPTNAATTGQLQVTGMRYLVDPSLGPPKRRPLYLFGTSFEVSAYAPGVMACDDQTIECRTVPVERCPRTPVYTSLAPDARLLPDGTGIAVAHEAIFIRAPAVSVSDTPAWRCTEPELYRDLRGSPDAPATAVDGFVSVGSVQDRAFVCADAKPRAECGQTAAMVLTSTASGGHADWRAVFHAPEGTRCHHFLDLPGQPNRVRLILTSYEYVDFDATGTKVGSGRLDLLLPGKTPAFFDVATLPSGATLMRTLENGVYRSGGGDAKFVRLYGTNDGDGGDYRGLIPTPRGFYAFGDPKRLIEVVVPKATSGGAHPDPKVCEIDWNGFLMPNDHVLGAVRDSSRTDQYAVLVAGYNDAGGVRPLLRRAFIAQDQATGDSECTSKVGDLKGGGAPSLDVALPPAAMGRKFIGLAETGPGHFVVITDDTRLFTVDGNQAAELPIDWDVPGTPAIETMPKNDPDPCSHQTPPLDAWRSIDGGHGVAWIVGDRGLIFRVSGGKTERFLATSPDDPTMTAPLSATWTSVQAACPDRVLIGGSFVHGNIGDRSGVFEIAHAGSMPACTPYDLQRGADDALILRQMEESCIAFADAPQLVFASPATFFEDDANVWVGFDNGYIHRFGANNSKVPFAFRQTVQNPEGVLLFGGGESRLAVGFPAGKSR